MNQSLTNFIKQRADKVWNYWEENQTEPFIDDFNKVGSFSDWMDEQTDDDLREISQLYYAGDNFITMLRAEISKGLCKFFSNNTPFII